MDFVLVVRGVDDHRSGPPFVGVIAVGDREEAVEGRLTTSTHLQGHHTWKGGNKYFKDKSKKLKDFNNNFNATELYGTLVRVHS